MRFESKAPLALGKKYLLILYFNEEHLRGYDLDSCTMQLTGRLCLNAAQTGSRVCMLAAETLTQTELSVFFNCLSFIYLRDKQMEDG